MGKTTVLFIAGYGRSGSTFFGNILGQLPGFFHVGELSYLWRQDVIDNSICGCGAPLAECPAWSAILGESFGGIKEALGGGLLKPPSGAIPSHKKLFLHALAPSLTTLDAEENRAKYAKTLGRLYSAVGSYDGNRVIVDSSKTPSYAYMLGQIPDVDVRFVHLVRDPRATAFSWQRKKDRAGAKGNAIPMERYPLWESTGGWVSWNAAVPIVAKLIGAPVLRIQYESFVLNPRDAVRRALSLVEDVCKVPEESLPFVGPSEVELKPTHTVWGNPNRQKTGRVQVKPDSEWSTTFGGWRMAAVTGLTFPLARQYGYFALRKSPR